MTEQSPAPDRRAPLVAIVLVAVGAVFLIGEIFNVRFGAGFWPFVIIVPGVMLLASGYGRGGRVNSGAATAGAVLTTLGLILWYQNISDNWESWAYIWALLPLSAGVAQMVAGARNDDEPLAAGGRQTAQTAAIMFAVGIVFFELIIFDRGGFGGFFLPLALIAAGGYMLWRHNNRGGSMPWGDMFSGAGPSAPVVTPTSPQPQTAAGDASLSAVATPPPSSEPFPEDDLPHQPSPDDAPFPADEQSPGVPTEEAPAPAGASDQPQTDAPTPKPRKAAPRRRSSTARKSTTSRKTPPSEG